MKAELLEMYTRPLPERVEKASKALNSFVSELQVRHGLSDLELVYVLYGAISASAKTGKPGRSDSSSPAR